LDERLTAVEELADLYQKRFEGASKTVADLRNAVHGMFQKFGCSTAAVHELLGDEGVSDRNILQHLSVIEQRVNEILRMYGGSLTRMGADMDHLKVCITCLTPMLRKRISYVVPRYSYKYRACYNPWLL
jgi:hypothetical protein